MGVFLDLRGVFLDLRCIMVATQDLADPGGVSSVLVDTVGLYINFVDAMGIFLNYGGSGHYPGLGKCPGGPQGLFLHFEVTTS